MAKIHKDSHGLYLKWKNHIWRPESSTFTEGARDCTTMCKEGEEAKGMYQSSSHFLGFKAVGHGFYEFWHDHGCYKVEKHYDGMTVKGTTNNEHMWNPATIPPPTCSVEDLTKLLHQYRAGTSNRIDVIKGKWAVVDASTLGWEVLGASYEEVEAYLKAHPMTKDDQMNAFKKALESVTGFKIPD